MTVDIGKGVSVDEDVGENTLVCTVYCVDMTDSFEKREIDEKRQTGLWLGLRRELRISVKGYGKVRLKIGLKISLGLGKDKQYG